MRATYTSPIGKIYLSASDDGLVFCGFRNQPPKENTRRKEQSGTKTKKGKTTLTLAARQLKRYFAGDANALNKLPVAKSGTAFEQAVWREMRRIKPGTPVSYGQLAIKLKRPGAARAVGTACKKNPVCLVVPCHRVIASNGKLGGYSAGLSRKRYLLTLESQR